LVFIYTEEDFSEILKNLDATYRPNEKLVYQFEHRHYTIPNAQEKFKAMISDFKLSTP